MDVKLVILLCVASVAYASDFYHYSPAGYNTFYSIGGYPVETRQEYEIYDHSYDQAPALATYPFAQHSNLPFAAYGTRPVSQAVYPTAAPQLRSVQVNGAPVYAVQPNAGSPTSATFSQVNGAFNSYQSQQAPGFPVVSLRNVQATGAPVYAVQPTAGSPTSATFSQVNGAFNSYQPQQAHGFPVVSLRNVQATGAPVYAVQPTTGSPTSATFSQVNGAFNSYQSQQAPRFPVVSTTPASIFSKSYQVGFAHPQTGLASAVSSYGASGVAASSSVNQINSQSIFNPTPATPVAYSTTQSPIVGNNAAGFAISNYGVYGAANLSPFSVSRSNFVAVPYSTPSPVLNNVASSGGFNFGLNQAASYSSVNNQLNKFNVPSAESYTGNSILYSSTPNPLGQNVFLSGSYPAIPSLSQSSGFSATNTRGSIPFTYSSTPSPLNVFLAGNPFASAFGYAISPTGASNAISYSTTTANPLNGLAPISATYSAAKQQNVYNSGSSLSQPNVYYAGSVNPASYTTTPNPLFQNQVFLPAGYSVNQGLSYGSVPINPISPSVSHNGSPRPFTYSTTPAPIATTIPAPTASTQSAFSFTTTTPRPTIVTTQKPTQTTVYTNDIPVKVTLSPFTTQTSLNVSSNSRVQSTTTPRPSTTVSFSTVKPTIQASNYVPSSFTTKLTPNSGSSSAQSTTVNYAQNRLSNIASNIKNQQSTASANTGFVKADAIASSSINRQNAFAASFSGFSKPTTYRPAVTNNVGSSTIFSKGSQATYTTPATFATKSSFPVITLGTTQSPVTKTTNTGFVKTSTVPSTYNRVGGQTSYSTATVFGTKSSFPTISTMKTQNAVSQNFNSGIKTTAASLTLKPASSQASYSTSSVFGARPTYPTVPVITTQNPVSQSSNDGFVKSTTFPSTPIRTGSETSYATSFALSERPSSFASTNTRTGSVVTNTYTPGYVNPPSGFSYTASEGLQSTSRPVSTSSNVYTGYKSSYSKPVFSTTVQNTGKKIPYNSFANRASNSIYQSYVSKPKYSTTFTGIPVSSTTRNSFGNDVQTINKSVNQIGTSAPYVPSVNIPADIRTGSTSSTFSSVPVPKKEFVPATSSNYGASNVFLQQSIPSVTGNIIVPNSLDYSTTFVGQAIDVSTPPSEAQSNFVHADTYLPPVPAVSNIGSNGFVNYVSQPVTVAPIQSFSTVSRLSDAGLSTPKTLPLSYASPSVQVQVVPYSSQASVKPVVYTTTPVITKVDTSPTPAPLPYSVPVGSEYTQFSTETPVTHSVSN